MSEFKGATVAASVSVAQPLRVARPRDRVLTSRLIATMFFLDVLALSAAVPLAMAARFGAGNWRPPTVEWATGVPAVDFGWVVPVWMSCLAFQDVYTRRSFGRGVDDYKALLRGSLQAGLIVSALAYLANHDMSRGFYLWLLFSGTVLLLAERTLVLGAVKRLRAANLLMRRVVAVGGSAELARLHAQLEKRSDLGYEIIGVCAEPAPEVALSIPVLGRPEQAVQACLESGGDTLLVAGGAGIGSDHLRAFGWQLEGADIDLIVLPSLMDVAGPRIRSRPVSGLALLHVEPPQVDRAMRWGKAAFDRLVASLLVLLLAPVMVAVAIAVRIEERGPVLFRQRRIGLGGRDFWIWKFRSMALDAENRHPELVRTSGASPLLFKLQRDPRVTRVGAFIRRYSLDELPQLFNVIAGDMSLVGPRPQSVAEVSLYGDSDARRLLVRPGMTGLWQVSGRSGLSWDDAVRLDLYYIDNWTMSGDLVILFKTIRAVLQHDGAY